MPGENKNFFASTAGIIIIVLLVFCCCCLIISIAAMGGLYLFGNSVTSASPVQAQPFSFGDATSTPTPPVEITRVPVEAISTATIKTLEKSIVPVNDPLDIACRLQNKCGIPKTLLSGPYKTGDKLKFWLSNTDTAENFQIDATLKYVTDHAYFWVEDGVTYNQKDAKKLVDDFENKMYPTNREFFGSEWAPGVDDDPHIYLVYSRGIGGSVAGYFSSPDEYHTDAHEYSNAHEMFVFNADNSPLSDTYTYGVLAHEFQHMIHWNQDLNETSWINEGFSELAVLLNGYYVGGADYEYISDTDVQLTDWGPDPGTNGPHYGSSFLFLTYFLDRFGEEATKALVQDPQNSMESVNNILKSIDAKDGLSGKPISADDVFMDWAVTNYLQDGSVADGRYAYHNYDSAPKASDTESITECPSSINRTVKQYGVDYIRIECTGEHTITFEGATQTGLLPVDAYSGKMAFWSNKGDESDMTLTKEFDFSDASGPLTFEYYTWYDIEKDYDYLYLVASTDGGKTWKILQTPTGTDTNPSGNSYGWGYTDKTDNWIKESIDISEFSGKKVQLRFEYITDAAVNGEGLLLDDVSIPETNYFTDFENGDDGWISEGFARIENVLPQTFRLSVIDQNGNTTVQNVEIATDQTAQITLDLSNVTLVVSGVTPFTREDGHYNISIK